MARPHAGSRLGLGLAGPNRLQVQENLGFGGGCGCKFLGWEVVLLSLNVVVFFVRFLVVRCAVCCALFCGQIIREVVHFLCSFCMGSCAFDIFYLFQKHGREHKKKHDSKQGFSLSKICPLAKLVTEKFVP